jgi:hypothetical protein
MELRLAFCTCGREKKPVSRNVRVGGDAGDRGQRERDFSIHGAPLQNAQYLKTTRPGPMGQARSKLFPEILICSPSVELQAFTKFLENPEHANRTSVAAGTDRKKRGPCEAERRLSGLEHCS